MQNNTFENAILQADGSVVMFQDGKFYVFTSEEFRRTFGYSADLVFKAR
jgi:hypothetical protein